MQPEKNCLECVTQGKVHLANEPISNFAKNDVKTFNWKRLLYWAQIILLFCACIAR